MNSNVEAPEIVMESADEFTYSRKVDDLPGPKGLPYIGNQLQMRGQQWHLKLEKFIREFGPIYRLNAFGIPIVVVSDRASITDLLKERPDGFERNRGLRARMNELKVGGVFTAEGDDWRKQRKLVMGGLTFDVVKNFFPTMGDMTERMLLRWKAQLASGKTVDLRRDLKALALDIIVGIAMGYDLGAVNDDGNPLQLDLDTVLQRLASRGTALYPYWHRFKLPVDHAADKAALGVEQAVLGFITETRERMKLHPEIRDNPTNMLEAMIAASEDPESDFTDQELVSNAIASVVGGIDTTANSIAWMINLLAKNPDAAAKLTAEVDAVLGDARISRDWDQMKLFPYLDAAHSETQRLRSATPFLGFISTVDRVILDTFIPKGSVIFTPTNFGDGLDEAQFPQHEKFLPERWIFEHKPQRDEDPSRKVFPFGGGARLCPGRFLALTEIKVVVSMIVRNFELEFDTKAPPVQQVMNFFMGPSAVPVRLKPRA
jgi:cytochrome P450